VPESPEHADEVGDDAVVRRTGGSDDAVGAAKESHGAIEVVRAQRPHCLGELLDLKKEHVLEYGLVGPDLLKTARETLRGPDALAHADTDLALQLGQTAVAETLRGADDGRRARAGRGGDLGRRHEQHLV